MINPKINPNDSAMPSTSSIIGFEQEFKAHHPGLSKREKLIFDLFVKYSSCFDHPNDSEFAATNAVVNADILIAEMNKDSEAK